MGNGIVFFGIGDYGSAAVDYALKRQIDINCIVDNDSTKWGTMYNGIVINAPEVLVDFGSEVVITASMRNRKQILRQLLDMGFVYGKNIFTCADKLNHAKLASENFAYAREIDKGFQACKKYYVEDDKGNRFFLRISDISQCSMARKGFEAMKKAHSLGIPTPLPIDFFELDWGGYSLHRWSDGGDLADLMPSLKKKEQYTLGVKSGEILRKLHSIPPELNSEEWPAYLSRKLKKIIECGLQYSDNEKMLIRYVEKNLHLARNRPVCFIHCDYSPYNILSHDNELEIIDFDTSCYGDPLYDLCITIWKANVSPRFAVGQLREYFGGDPSEEAWSLLALYVSHHIVDRTYQMAFNVPDLLNAVRQRSSEVLFELDNMKKTIPAWYSP